MTHFLSVLFFSSASCCLNQQVKLYHECMACCHIPAQSNAVAMGIEAACTQASDVQTAVKRLTCEMHQPKKGLLPERCFQTLCRPACLLAQGSNKELLLKCISLSAMPVLSVLLVSCMCSPDETTSHTTLASPRDVCWSGDVGLQLK